MQSRAANFRFIDLPTSAERLGITRNQLLQIVDEGRIKPFTGSGQQSVFRASDVDRLAQELGRAAQAAAEAETAETSAETETPAPGGRPRRRDPIKLIGTRLSMDSRWAEITDEDVATWVDALEPVQFERVRKVGGLAIERIKYVLAQVDEQEQKLQSRSSGSGS